MVTYALSNVSVRWAPVFSGLLLNNSSALGLATSRGGKLNIRIFGVRWDVKRSILWVIKNWIIG